MKKKFWWIEIPSLTPKEKTAFVLIILFGLILRLWRIWNGLPYGLNPDEPLLLREALRFGKNLNIGEFVKSAPFMFFNFTFLSLYYVAGKILGFFHSSEDIAITFVRDPFYLYFILRCTSAILSTLSIFLMGFFLHKIFKRKEALFLSALLYSLFPASVITGRMVKEDNLAIPLFLIALIYLYSLYEEGGWKKFFIAGFLSGVAVAGKGYAVFLYPLLFYFWLERKENWKALLFSIFGIIIGNSIVNPYPYFNLDRNITNTFLGPLLPAVLQLAGIRGSGETFRYAKLAGGFGTWERGSMVELGKSIQMGMGWLFAVLSLAGFLYTLLKKEEKQRKIPPLIFVIIYSPALLLAPQSFPHYLLPLVPFLLILTFNIFYELKGKYGYFLMALIAISFLLTSLREIMPAMLGVPTEKLALEWVKKNIGTEKKILIDQGLLTFGLPEKKETIIREFEEYRLIDPSIAGRSFEIRLRFADENGYDLYRKFIYEPELLGLSEKRPGLYTPDEVMEKFDYVIVEGSNVEKAKRSSSKWMRKFYLEALEELEEVIRFRAEGIKSFGSEIIIYRVKR